MVIIARMIANDQNVHGHQASANTPADAPPRMPPPVKMVQICQLKNRLLIIRSQVWHTWSTGTKESKCHILSRPGRIESANQCQSVWQNDRRPNPLEDSSEDEEDVIGIHTQPTDLFFFQVSFLVSSWLYIRSELRLTIVHTANQLYPTRSMRL